MLPLDWPKRRIRVLRLEGYRCHACGAPTARVGQIAPGADFDYDNLRAVCGAHIAGRQA